MDPLNSANSQTFSYDGLNRLASFTNGSGSMQQTYTIDPWGNLSQSGTLSSVVSYNTNNRVTTSGYGYDAAGNLTSFYNGMSTVNYTYDPDGRLLTAANGSAKYFYDGSGGRVRDDLGSSNWTEFTYLNGQPIEEVNSNGTWTDYIFGNGERLAMASSVNATSPSTTTDYYSADQIGSARIITNGSGAVISSYTFYPFGQGQQPDENHYLFTGKERDSESGLDYFEARYYGSSMGRFMSPDDFGGHLEDPQTLNKYSYAGNNPLRYTDPTGHDFWQSCDTASATCGNQVIGKGTDGKDITQLVSGTTDSNGKFTATVVTSASLGQAGSGNTAAVNGSGVQITTGTGTSSQQTGQGIFIANTPAADIQGQGTGWNQFSFHIDSNDVAHGVLDSGTATYNGSGGHQGMLDAINSMKAGSNGPWQYPGEDHYNGLHPGATNFRFSTGDHPVLFNYGPSPHFPVPGAGTSVPNFHIDNGTGPLHVICAKKGYGCY